MSYKKNIKIQLYKNVYLHMCEKVCHLKDEKWLKVFEDSLVRRIFGPKREEVAESRKLHNGKLIAQLY
jgi:hypothetical protein